MVFGRELRLLGTAAFIAACTIAPATEAWIAPLVTKGNKMFYADSGKEFRMKGMAYYPRPNGGELSQVNNYDWFTDDYEHVWRPHLEIMKELGINTIRLYAVDPSQSHDKFMCACSEAGMYVIVGLAASCWECAVVDAQPPDCYPPVLLTRAQKIYNAFAVYDNTLAFSVDNENNLQSKYGADGTTTAPCVKAFLRDVRNYADHCAGSLRKIPIGLDIADLPPRRKWLEYYDCAVDDNEYTRAEWIGFNPYVECNPKKHKTYDQSAGLQNLMKDYADVAYSRPIMLGEFGCIEGANTVDGWENQRGFYDAKWMNDEPEMAREVIGGCVFEFSTEIANLKFEKKITKKHDPGRYGIGYFHPEDCDHDEIPCEFVPYPEFDNLKKAYLATEPSELTLGEFEPTRDKMLQCPREISADLPGTPDVEILACSVRKPECKGSSSNGPPRSQVTSGGKMGDKKPPTDDAAPTRSPDEEETPARSANENERAPVSDAGEQTVGPVSEDDQEGTSPAPSSGTDNLASGASRIVTGCALAFGIWVQLASMV